MRCFAVPLLSAVSAFPLALPGASFLATTAIGPTQPFIQTVPVTATKTRITYSLGPTGGIRLLLEERWTFSRNGDGDEAIHLKVIRDGHALPGSSVISQRKEGLRYVLDDARQQYKVLPWSPIATVNEADRQATPSVTRVIDGIKCVAATVRDSAGKAVGKDWVSPDYRITVRSEMDVVDAQTGLLTGLVVEELTEMRIGEAPDPSAFIIPIGYKRVDSRGSH